jgi:hypothetical protein
MKIPMTREDIELISAVVEENDLNTFYLVVENGSGIGSTMSVELDIHINGRKAKAYIPIADVENW